MNAVCSAFRAEIACFRSVHAVIAAGILTTLAAIAPASCSRADPVPAGQDVFIVTIAEDLRSALQTGRLMLFFITEQDPKWSMRQPLNGPYYENPQPIASIAVENWTGETAVVVSDESAIVFEGPMRDFSGSVRVQALLHVNDDRPRLLPGPGCLYSGVVRYDARSDAADRVEIVLDQRIDDPASQIAARTNLRVVELRSERLSAELGRNVTMRAYVVTPADHESKPDEAWPAVYIIPDRLEDPLGAAVEWSDTWMVPNIDEVAANALHIVLDPQTSHGHHGFIDSGFHGVRATALLEELIPHLEKEFRLSPRSEARILSGFGLGAWSALWLQLHHPDVFGGCWASGPTPIDFRAFQQVNMYDDTNVFESEDGDARQAYRRLAGITATQPTMTVQQMSQLERAIDPDGRSGGLYDTLNAMYSPADQPAGKAKRLFEPATGAIDSAVVEQWRRYDVVERVSSDWGKYRPILEQRVHLYAAGLDSYYFDHAVLSFTDAINELPGGADAAAKSIHIIDTATYENLQRHVAIPWNDAMRAYLKNAGVAVE